MLLIKLSVIYYRSTLIIKVEKKKQPKKYEYFSSASLIIFVIISSVILILKLFLNSPAPVFNSRPKISQKVVKIQSIFPNFSIQHFAQMEPLHKMRSPSGVREFSVCQNERLFLVVVYDTVRLYDIQLGTTVKSVQLESTPKSAKLSQCGKYFFIHDSENGILLYDTKTGDVIQRVIGAENATKMIRFSKNSQKLIYGSTQILCLWNIRKCSIDIRTEHWKNMSCYDVNKNGTQFAIGTYNGNIYVNDFIDVGRCSQILIKRHKTCIAAICCHEEKIISASQDGYFLISTLSKDSNDERIISYHEMKMKSIPKEIESVGNNYYMFNNEGMTWFTYGPNGLVLTGFTDHKIYKPFVNEDGKIIFMSSYAGEMEWWPINVFKTNAEIQREKALRQKQKSLEKCRRNSAGAESDNLDRDPQNKIIHRVSSKRQNIT